MTPEASPANGLPDWFSSEDVHRVLARLERLWMDVERAIPTKETGSGCLVYELAQMMFENNGDVPDACSDPQTLREAYRGLENRWLVDLAGRGMLISALQHQVLHGAPNADGGLPREAELKLHGIAFVDIALRVELPPVSPDAHRGVAVICRADPRELLAKIPVPEITGYKSAVTGRSRSTPSPERCLASTGRRRSRRSTSTSPTAPCRSKPARPTTLCTWRITQSGVDTSHRP